MGLLAAAEKVPYVLVGLFAGVWVDRLRCRSLLVAADFGRAVLLGSIPLAPFSACFTWSTCCWWPCWPSCRSPRPHLRSASTRSCRKRKLREVILLWKAEPREAIFFLEKIFFFFI
jgi:hypothetical protein